MINGDRIERCNTARLVWTFQMNDTFTPYFTTNTPMLRSLSSRKCREGARATASSLVCRLMQYRRLEPSVRGRETCPRRVEMRVRVSVCLFSHLASTLGRQNSRPLPHFPHRSDGILAIRLCAVRAQFSPPHAVHIQVNTVSGENSYRVFLADQ